MSKVTMDKEISEQAESLGSRGIEGETGITNGSCVSQTGMGGGVLWVLKGLLKDTFIVKIKITEKKWNIRSSGEQINQLNSLGIMLITDCNTWLICMCL